MEFKGTKEKLEQLYGFECIPLGNKDKTIVTFWGNDEEAYANALIFKNSYKMLEMLKFASEKLKSTTEYDVLDRYKEYVSNIEQLIKEATEI